MAAAPQSNFWQRYGTAVFGGVLVLIVVLVVAAAVLRRPSDAALVFATAADCLRAHNAETCAGIEAEALAVHARTAPRFPDRRMCLMMFDDAGCTEVQGLTGQDRAYVPQIAVTLMTRAKGDEPQVLLPLYFGNPKPNETTETGRRVYYRGIVVGVMLQNRFGGAQIPRVRDLSGRPFSSANVLRLRRG